MAVVVPAGIPATGSVKVIWVPTLTTPTAPKLTEISAGTAIELSCYLKSDGFNPSSDQDSGDDKRLCSKVTFESPGAVKVTIDDLTYIYDVQTPASVSNKAYAAMTNGAIGYLVVRWGKDVDTNFAVGDVLDVYPVTLGPRRKQAPEENSPMYVKQKPFVTGKLNEDVVMVA